MPALVISQIPPVSAHLTTASSGYLHLFAGFVTFSQHLTHASSGYIADSAGFGTFSHCQQWLSPSVCRF
jgi:hypothetical protein